MKVRECEDDVGLNTIKETEVGLNNKLVGRDR